MTIDFNTVEFQDGDFTREEDFSDMIETSDSITLDSWISFYVTGLEDSLLIDFTQKFSGHWTYCPGDRWTPPDSDFDLTENEIYINIVKIDDIEVEMTPEFENVVLSILLKEIEKSTKRNYHIRV